MVARCICLYLLLFQLDFHVINLILQLLVMVLELAKFLAGSAVLLLLS